MQTWIKKTSQTATFSCCVMLSLVGCTGRGEKPETSPPTKQPMPRTSVTLATSKNIWCALPLIAKNKGFFAAEGLDVTYNFQSAGRYCMDALISQSAEFGNVVEVNVAFLGFTGNKNVKVIATCVESDSSAIIARKSRGISSAKDLKGKRIALSPGTTSDVFANWYLRGNGIGTKDVEIRKLQPTAIQASMVAGEIDAASTWEPFVTNCRKAIGNDAIEFRDSKAYLGYENVATRADWAAQHPQAVAAFLRALKNAERFVADHREESQQILSKEISLDISTVKSTWKYYRIGLTLDQNKLVSAITAEGQWIHQTQEGFSSKSVPDYSSFFDGSFFTAVK